MEILRMEHITKSFQKHVVFDDFNMSVHAGEFVVVEGASGSGKSTLLNMIGLLDRPDSGDIYLFDEKNIKPFSRKAESVLKNKLGYLFQNFALIEHKSVYYNMMIGIDHYAMKNKKECIKNALAQVGLQGYEDKYIHECSGGEQQRIAIARLLMKPCELILADEPTGSLDTKNKREIFSLLLKLRENGKTVIVVSHDPELINIADRTVTITAHPTIK